MQRARAHKSRRERAYSRRLGQTAIALSRNCKVSDVRPGLAKELRGHVAILEREIADMEQR